VLAVYIMRGPVLSKKKAESAVRLVYLDVPFANNEP